ncbi:MAG: DNA polymerase [Candidatus Anstonellales archaeon]
MRKLVEFDYKVDKPDINYLKLRVEELMRKGIRLSSNIVELKGRIEGILKELEEEIRKNYGIDNVNSSRQIVEYLKGLKSGEVYEYCYVDGKWSSSKEALSPLAELGYQFAIDILAYRKMKKYIDSINSLVENADKNMFIHPTVSLGKTNRVNYTNPALMNIPKELLWHVIAPRREGNIIYSIDIKNQEPNILIHVLGIEELREVLKQDGSLYDNLFKKIFKVKAMAYIHVMDSEYTGYISKDKVKELGLSEYYLMPLKVDVPAYYNNKKVDVIEVVNVITNKGIEPVLPSEVSVDVEGNVYKLGVKWNEVDKKKLKKEGVIELEGEVLGVDVVCDSVSRSEFKVAWNALTYGSSLAGLKKICKNINAEVIYKYFNSLEGYRKYKNVCMELANKGSQYIKTVFGTLLCANESDKSRLHKVLMDLPIQGTGADILALLVKHLDNEVSKLGLSDKVMLYYTRHDELIIEIDKIWYEEKGEECVEGVLRSLLEHRIKGWEPFKLDIEKVQAKPISIYDNREEM